MFKKRITEQDIFNVISDVDIFHLYFGEVDLNRNYPSIFRIDNDPSTGFFLNKQGRLVYNDFSKDEQLGCIEFVQKLFNLNYGQALDKIAIDFKIKDGVCEAKPNRVLQRPKKKDKKYAVNVGRWTDGELSYWKDYGITKEELINNNVSPVRRICVNGFEIPNEENYIKFLYIINYKGKEYIKIYSPHDKKFKWMGNVPGYALFGWDELKFKSDTLIVAKSQKERLIFLKFFPDVIAIQSERVGAISEEDITLLRSKFKRILYFGDNDTTGLRVVQEFKEAGFEAINYPERFLTSFGVKDTGDFVKKWGLDYLAVWLKKNINL